MNIPHLMADVPHADIPHDKLIFLPCIGSWDLTVTWYQRGREIRSEQGEWHFGWILQGRAVQDVWIVPRLDLLEPGSRQYEFGTSIRFYDRSIDAWRSTWIGPIQEVVKTFVARQINDQIVLDTEPEAPRLRWVFSDMTPDSFVWRNWHHEAGE